MLGKDRGGHNPHHKRATRNSQLPFHLLPSNEMIPIFSFSFTFFHQTLLYAIYALVIRSGRRSAVRTKAHISKQASQQASKQTIKEAGEQAGQSGAVQSKAFTN